MSITEPADSPAPTSRKHPSIVVGLAAAIAVGLAVGALTAYAQGWLSDETTSLANSAWSSL